MANLQRAMCHNDTYDNAEDSLVYLKEVELCCLHSFDLKMWTWPGIASLPQPTNDFKTLRHDSQNSTHAFYEEIGQPGTCDVAYQCNSSHIVR